MTKFVAIGVRVGEISGVQSDAPIGDRSSSQPSDKGESSTGVF